MALGTPGPSLSAAAAAGGQRRFSDNATGADLGAVARVEQDQNSPVAQTTASIYDKQLQATTPPPMIQQGGMNVGNTVARNAPGMIEANNRFITNNAQQLAQQNANMLLAGAGHEMALADLNYGIRDRRRSYDLGMRGLGLSQQGLGIDRENLNTNRARLGLDRQGLGVDRNYINQMQQYARQALGETLGGIDRNEKFDIRDTRSDYAGRGTWFSPFHRQDVQRVQDTATQGRNEANIGYGRESAGYNRDLARNSLSDQGIDLSYQDLAGQEERLNLTAQQLGLQGEELAAMLESGLNSLGVNYDGAMFDILAGLGAGDPEAIQMFFDAAVKSGDPAALRFIGNMLSGASGNPGMAAPNTNGMSSSGY